MKNIHVTKDPVTLEGYQAILRPSKFGYSLKAVVGQDIVDALETERADCLKWAESKLKNPKRSTCRPEPWEEVAEGQYKVKFSWNADNRPPIVDTEGTLITDENIPIYSGSKVKLAFYQKPYILKDQTTYGSSLKLKGVQIVSLSSSAGVDVGDMSNDDVTALFGKTAGFKVSEPNVIPAEPSAVDEDDF